LFSKDKKKAWLGQPHLIQSLKKKFYKITTRSQSYRTPGTPGQGIVRPTSKEEKVKKGDQTLHRSGVGMLLYLVKHSCPDIANIVQELSKCINGANKAARKEF
jgi:hypothetical protein